MMPYLMGQTSEKLNSLSKTLVPQGGSQPLWGSQKSKVKSQNSKFMHNCIPSFLRHLKWYVHYGIFHVIN